VTTLEARRVIAAYGSRVVLRECDLRVDSGELVAIVGPNGAGKSTLLRVCAGLIRPSAGEVRIDDVRLDGLSRAALAKRIAVVPQLLETLFPFTVREIVGLGRTARLGLLGRPGAADHAVVESSLSTLDLVSLADRRIDALSGGERQRAVLAMALAQEADVLLLDEPTVHLDPGHQVATLELVRRLARERSIAILAVLHDLNLALALATRVVVMDRGKVVSDGAPSATLTAERVRAVFGAALDVVSHQGRVFVVPDGTASHAGRSRVRD